MLNPTNKYQGAPPISVPSSTSSIPRAAPASVVEGGRPVKKTHKEEATMLVSSNRWVIISMALVAELSALLQRQAPTDIHAGLRTGKVVDLIPPKRRGLWILDTHPRAGGSALMSADRGSPRFITSYYLGPQQMTACRSIVLNDKGHRRLVCESLDRVELVLVGPDPTRPGIFFFKARKPV